MNGTTSLPASTERRRSPNRAPGVGSALVIAGLALLHLPAEAPGQVQFVNASSGQSGTTTTSFAFPHTVSAGTDRVLIVGGAIRAGAPVNFTNMTYNGIALTRILGVTGADDVRAELWYLINPPVGTFDVRLTASASRNLAGGAMTFTGVHQTTPIGTPDSAGGQSNSTSVTVTSAPGEMVVDVVAQRDPGTMGTLTAGPLPQAEQYRRDHTNTNMRIAGSTEVGAASVTMSWTFTLDPRHAQVAVPLKPSGAAPPAPNLTIGKAVAPPGAQPPGTDLTYTVTITNGGSANAVTVVVVDTLPAQVDFQVGSVVSNLPPGISVVVEYSNDGGSTWTYVPASGACLAPAGYDRCVNRVRWRLLNDLSSTPPDNTGTLEFVARIR